MCIIHRQISRGQGGCTLQMRLLSTLVLADYTDIWEITNEGFSCNSSKTLNQATFMPTVHVWLDPLKIFPDPPIVSLYSRILL